MVPTASPENVCRTLESTPTARFGIHGGRIDEDIDDDDDDDDDDDSDDDSVVELSGSEEEKDPVVTVGPDLNFDSVFVFDLEGAGAGAVGWRFRLDA